jgi:hypothetical protein
VRRMKTYSAQSGYVYQYFYEGRRGAAYVFSISADRKNWAPLEVTVEEHALDAWEQSHARQLSGTERYAIAKIALFQAFDERPDPKTIHAELRVASVDAIVEALGL